MALFSIIYEIKSPEANIEDLEFTIEDYPYKKISNSSYIIESNLSPKMIYEKLRQYITPLDTLLIISFKQPWYGRGDNETIDWIIERS